MAETYYELLRRPEWQKKRLKIMERDNFECRECGDATTTLNVHHNYYTKGAKPWEYPDEALACLCEPCHERVHGLRDELKRVVGLLGSSGLELVLGYAKGTLLNQECCGPDDTETRVAVNSHEQAEGLADAWGMARTGFTINGKKIGPNIFPAEERIIAALGTGGVIDCATLDAIRDTHYAAAVAESRESAGEPV